MYIKVPSPKNAKKIADALERIAGTAPPRKADRYRRLAAALRKPGFLKSTTAGA